MHPLTELVHQEADAEKVTRITELRSLLAEKFPSVPTRQGGTISTGLHSLDEQGGLRRGVLTELSSSSGGGALFLDALISAVAQSRSFLALIDAARSFDPQSCDPAALARVLWVLCDTPEQAVKAADLLLRDGNLPLILLDLQPLSRRAIGRIPASTWHRFQRLVEQSGAALVILTPQPLIEGAKIRVAVRTRWSLPALRRRRRGLVEELEAQVFHRSSFTAETELEQHIA
jgi:RecA/RadA recombinase